jgi:hypothetical protein
MHAMSKRGTQKDVRAIYRQQLLSGFKDYGEPENWNGDGNKSKGANPQKAKLPKQKSYLVSIPVIITEVGLGDNKHEYKISINAHSDLSIQPYSERSKKASNPVVGIPQEKGKKADTLPMVYGIYSDGQHTLSPSPRLHPVRAAEVVYSNVLGAIDRAIRFTLLQQSYQEADDDPTERDKGTRSPKDLGEDTIGGGSEKVRPKIRSKALPKKAPNLDETDG